MDNDSDAPSETNHPPPMPKHIPFPEVPGCSELVNELIMFLFIVVSGAMQFLHIYRTVWWIPYTYINHTINYYLIDPNLVVFAVILFSRKFLYCLMIRCLELCYNERRLRSYKLITRYIFGALILVPLGYCTAQVYGNENYLSLLLLVYPIVVYIAFFGFAVEPFFSSSCEVSGSYLNGLPMHCCSSSPVNIRDEVECLKNDFNHRCKQVVFTSIVNAYYGGFVPCFFAQNFMRYNVVWALQHILFIFIGAFTMGTVFCFPARYSDILHRSALHLGIWQRLEEPKKTNVFPYVWSKSVTWKHASVVRYAGYLYKSLGPATTALPGNMSHNRFFKIFINPSNLYMSLTYVQLFLIFYQMLILWFVVEWHHVLSLGFLGLTNHYTFFKILRDYFITKKVYAAEASITEKFSAHFQ